MKMGLVLWISLISFSSFAQSRNYKFPIQTFQTNQVTFQAYLSQKHHLLLLSFTNKANGKSACQPSQYVFFDYLKEDFFRIEGSDLKASPDFQNFFYGKIFHYGNSSKQALPKLKQKIKAFAEATKASSKTLQSAQRSSQSPAENCWQQGAWMNRTQQTPHSLPFLLASFCNDTFCPSFHWQGSDQVQTWARIEPEHFQQIRIAIDPKKPGAKKVSYLKQIQPFYRKQAKPENTPLADQIQRRAEGRISIFNKGKRNLWLGWQPTKKGSIAVSLYRDTLNIKAAKQWQKKIASTDPHRSEKLAFGLWLDPDNEKLIYRQLLATVKMKDYLGFFHKLRYNFDYKERVALCRKLHEDQKLQEHWKEQSFIALFDENCPR